jgi:hypothetical protein
VSGAFSVITEPCERRLLQQLCPTVKLQHCYRRGALDLRSASDCHMPWEILVGSGPDKWFQFRPVNSMTTAEATRLRIQGSRNLKLGTRVPIWLLWVQKTNRSAGRFRTKSCQSLESGDVACLEWEGCWYWALSRHTCTAGKSRKRLKCISAKGRHVTCRARIISGDLHSPMAAVASMSLPRPCTLFRRSPPVWRGMKTDSLLGAPEQTRHQASAPLQTKSIQVPIHFRRQ